MHLQPLSLIAALALTGAISTTLPALEFPAPAANPTVQTSNDDQAATATASTVIRYSAWRSIGGTGLSFFERERDRYVYSNKGVLLEHWIQSGRYNYRTGRIDIWANAASVSRPNVCLPTPHVVSEGIADT